MSDYLCLVHHCSTASVFEDFDELLPYYGLDADFVTSWERFVLTKKVIEQREKSYW